MQLGEKEGAPFSMSGLPKEFVSAATYYLYLGVGTKERQFLEKFAFYRYKEVGVPKRRGGLRTLLVPERRLKFLQRKTLKLLEQLYTARTPVHGFVEKKGAITNANEHQKRPYLLNIDISNYFGVISHRRVHGMLISLGFEEDVAGAVCTICTTRNQLPQGAPTSPILSNMIAYRMDRALMSFAKAHRLRYTRYADDISFSSYTQPVALFDAVFPLSGRVRIDQLSDPLRRIFASNGFDIAPEKVWFSGPKFRKEVTGLVVNEFTNVRRTFVRNLRAALYKAEKLGIAAAEADYRKRYKTTAALHDILRGRLEWLAQVRTRSFGPYRTLAKRFNILFPAKAIPILPTYDEIAERAVWVVEFFAETECAQGTAFFLDGVGLTTAHHVLEKLPAGQHADIYRPSDPGKKFKATVTGRLCPNRDLMILDHDIPEANYLSLPAATSPEHTNDDVIALGFPDFAPGEQLSKRRGHVIGRATKHGVKLVEVSAVLPGGMSGGPVVNDRYQVTAIIRIGGNQEHKQLGVDVSELIDLANE
jgi:RNA-directed DNA polymerase